MKARRFPVALSSLILAVTLVIVLLLFTMTIRAKGKVILPAGSQLTAAPALLLEKQANPNPAADGRPLTYTLVVTNNNTAVMTTTIIDHLPPQVTPGSDIVWSPVHLAPGESWTGQLVVTVTEGYSGTLVNHMEAASKWANNLSSCTTCAEEDNINIPLYAPGVTTYYITATHPAYIDTVPYDAAECAEDFSGCSGAARINQVTDDPCLAAPAAYDDGIDVLRVCQEPGWWRTSAMDVSINGSPVITGHRLVWNKVVAISGTNTYPQFLVLYEDGNLRLKPQPPPGRIDTCFGSSVIIGPAPEASRPFADIEQMDIDVVHNKITLHYAGGGSAVLWIEVNQTYAMLTVAPEYDTNLPFATFRSMYVSAANNDVSLLQTNRAGHAFLQGNVASWTVDWQTLAGYSWFFYRDQPSQHNVSSPDIHIASAEAAVFTASSHICSNVCSSYLPQILKFP